MLYNYRLRRIGPYLWVAGGSVFGSYSIAMYVDSTRRRRADGLMHRLLLGHEGVLGRERRMVRDDVVGQLQEFWRRSRESQKTVYSLMFLNSVVFCAWRIPALSGVLSRYFLHSITSHPLSMLGSIFSHRSFMHLLFNMLALNSFGVFLHDRMGREQFCAFYLSTGVASSLASHVYKSLRSNYTPSLGASGAIFGVVGGCAHHPDLKVSLIFLPIHSIPIGQALPMMMGLDLVGLVRNWRMFDHAAHLGGSVAGYALYPISQNAIWKNRRKIANFLSFSSIK